MLYEQLHFPLYHSSMAKISIGTPTQDELRQAGKETQMREHSTDRTIERFQMSDLLNPPSLQMYFYLHNLPVIFQKIYIYIFLNSLSPFDKISGGG